MIKQFKHLRMKMYVSGSNYLILLFVSLIPFFSSGQQIVELKIKGERQAKDSITLSNYFRNIERIRFGIIAEKDKPFKLTFEIPRVKIYNLADYYADGKFAYYPFNSWGPYQVPFHLNQRIIVPLKEK